MRTLGVAIVGISLGIVGACGGSEATSGGGAGRAGAGATGGQGGSGGKAGSGGAATSGGRSGSAGNGAGGDGDAGDPGDGGSDPGTGGKGLAGENSAGEGSGGSDGGGSGGKWGSAGAGGSSAGTSGAGPGAGSGGTSCEGSDVLTVSEEEGRSNYPLVAFTGDGYALVWTDDRDGNDELYFARIDASGNKVGADRRLTDAAGASFSASVAWTGSELGLTWSDARDGNTEVYFTRLDKSGARIPSAGLEDVRVTNDGARSEEPRIVWTGSEYGIIWGDTRDGTFQAYFARVSAAGAKLGGDVHVGAGASAELAAMPGGFGAVWHGAGTNGLQVFFTPLDATGNPAGATEPLGDPNLRGGNPRVAFDGTSFGVAWQANPGTGGELQWRRVSSAGAPLGQPVALSASGNTARAGNVRALAGGGFAVLWPDARSGTPELRFVEIAANGTPRGADVPVTNDGVDNTFTALTVAGDRYGGAWLKGATDTTGEVGFRIFCSP